jgi:iron complex transport system permease protein
MAEAARIMPLDKAVRRRTQESRAALVLGVLCVVLVLLFVVSVLYGRYTVPLHTWWLLLTNPSQSDTATLVLLYVRLPRVFAGILIGGGLAAAGAAYQGIFNNPMVSPDLLGASTGAGFGAALGLLMGCGIATIQMMSFVSGLLAVFLAWILSTTMSRRGDPVLVTVLVGLLIASVFASLISLVKFVADSQDRLPAITLWLMGSLSPVTQKDVGLAALPIILGLIPLLLLRWRLNVLSFGEEEARMLGVNTWRLRLIIVVCSTLITAASVAVAGMVGWVGLIVPHLARMMVGPNHKHLLPASIVLGSCFLLLVDDVARGIYTTEIPVGILTSLVGAPFFLYLLLRRQGERA